MARERKSTIAVVANSDWNIANYRLGLIKSLIADGADVVVIAPRGNRASVIEKTGARFVDLAMSRRGTSPIAEFAIVMNILRILGALRPDAVLTFTIKPNIYGSIAARLLGIPVINNVSGLGSAFSHSGPLRRIARALYRFALQRSDTIFFQNRDDRQLFMDMRLISKQHVDLLPGSGINTEDFSPAAPLDPRSAFSFLMVSRLLWDKGVRQFVEAAKVLKSDDVRFMILGILEAPSDAAVPMDTILQWVSEGLVTYLGEASDVRPFLAQADCVVLPSYYPEGVPRALLEASAMGIPVITTDTAGCRDAVVDGMTGFLCEPRSTESLVTAMKRLLALSPERRESFGRAARERMKQHFDERIVHRLYREALERALADAKSDHAARPTMMN